MEHAVIALVFIAMVMTPCVIASRIDLEAEEAAIDARRASEEPRDLELYGRRFE